MVLASLCQGKIYRDDKNLVKTLNIGLEQIMVVLKFI